VYPESLRAHSGGAENGKEALPRSASEKILIGDGALLSRDKQMTFAPNTGYAFAVSRSSALEACGTGAAQRSFANVQHPDNDWGIMLMASGCALRS
jgi:hypothetical protein